MELVFIGSIGCSSFDIFITIDQIVLFSTEQTNKIKIKYVKFLTLDHIVFEEVNRSKTKQIKQTITDINLQFLTLSKRKKKLMKFKLKKKFYQYDQWINVFYKFVYVCVTYMRWDEIVSRIIIVIIHVAVVILFFKFYLLPILVRKNLMAAFSE